MDIIKENIDTLNAVLKVHVTKDDYETKVTEVLNDYKKKATIKGFRPGKVPIGMIKKMAGKQVLVEEVNKLVLDSIYKYIINEKINILGEPLLSESKQPLIDWDNQTEYDFFFDLGLSPDVTLELDKIKAPYYLIKVEEEMINTQVNEYAKRYGRFIAVENIEGTEMIRGNIHQVDASGNAVENGIKADNISMVIDAMKDDASKTLFKDLKIGSEVVFNPKTAYPNDTDISGMLRIDKEAATNLTADFKIAITEIMRFENSATNQILFDKVFGENTVTSEDEFKNKIKEEIAKYLDGDSNYRFKIDVKEEILSKANIALPVEFLKRWMLLSNDKFTREQLDTEFPTFENDLKWQVIKNNLATKNDLSVTDEEVREFARKYAMMQFMQYGIPNVPDEQLDRFAETLLGREEDKRRMYDAKFEEKIFDFIKENAKLNNKEISRDDFAKLFEKEEA